MNTDKLRELALAATEGPWTFSMDENGYCDVLPAMRHGTIADAATKANAAYIAAANPTAILELLDALKEIGDDVKELRSKFYHYGNVAWGKDKPDVTEAYNICGDQLESILDKLCAS